jgi:hypothetical protein
VGLDEIEQFLITMRRFAPQRFGVRRLQVDTRPPRCAHLRQV